MLTTIILTLIVLGIMILFHEVGHFVAAKLSDVHVYEFALGMGPKLISTTRGETTYSLRMIPIGGFVRMAGEDPEDGEDPRGLNKKSYLARLIISFAGAFMNFVLAVLLFSVIIFFQGVPDQTAVIGEIFPDTPAAEIGLQTGDRFVEINGVAITGWSDITAQIKSRPNQSITITIDRQGEQQSFEVVTKQDELSKDGYIGIGPVLKRGSIFQAVGSGIRQTLLMIQMIIMAFVSIITGQTGAQGAGPLGIAQMVGEVSKTGVLNTLSFTAMLSINVGIFNLLPVPPLDGSRILLILIEAVRGKPIDPKKENLIFFIGFALLIMFAVFVTYQDILRLGF